MKLLAVLVVLLIATPTFAATLLSDGEMGEVYAGQYFEVNEVSARGSAVAAQSNIGAIAADLDNATSDTVLNINFADVDNFDGNSALAFQSNIGAIASLEGNVATAVVTNTNEAEVHNHDYNPGTRAVSNWGSSLEADECVAINQLHNTNCSAVALQSNIGAIYAGGSAVGSSVTNVNTAEVLNITND